MGGAHRDRDGRRGGPSSWRHRLPVLVLVLGGLVIAVDLTLVQLGAVAAWDPLFGDGTDRVLFSGLARSLPVPDAALGAVAYALEAAMVIPGGADRWATRPRPAAALGVLAIAMALGGIGLVLLQALVVRAFCTLCLGSAAVSIAAAVLDWPEARAAIGQLRAPRGPRASPASPASPASREPRPPTRRRPPHAHRLSSPRR